MRRAVIDMGTNSTRLAVGTVQDGKFQMVFTEVAETRLGEGMGTERVIRPVPLQRNVDTVQRFVQQEALFQSNYANFSKMKITELLFCILMTLFIRSLSDTMRFMKNGNAIIIFSGGMITL